MHAPLTAILSLAMLASLHAQQPATPAPAPAPQPIQLETREFRKSDLRDIRFDMADISVSFKVDNTTYRYRPSLSVSGHEAVPSEQIAVVTAFLSELRHASKVIISFRPNNSNDVFTSRVTLQYDSIK